MAATPLLFGTLAVFDSVSTDFLAQWGRGPDQIACNNPTFTVCRTTQELKAKSQHIITYPKIPPMILVFPGREIRHDPTITGDVHEDARWHWSACETGTVLHDPLLNGTGNSKTWTRSTPYWDQSIIIPIMHQFLAWWFDPFLAMFSCTNRKLAFANPKDLPFCTESAPAARGAWKLGISKHKGATR